MSFFNFFDANAKLIPSIVGTLGLFAFLLLWSWMIMRNYLQIFLFKRKGIYTHKGFKWYLHFEYNDIKKIEIVTFDSTPKFCKGEKIRGIDSILTAPKNPPKKWIAITDEKEIDNVCNYNSYLVPIRERMAIKIKYSDKCLNLVSKFTNCNIDKKTISFDEMIIYTPKSKSS